MGFIYFDQLSFNMKALKALTLPFSQQFKKFYAVFNAVSALEINSD